MLTACDFAVSPLTYHFVCDQFLLEIFRWEKIVWKVRLNADTHLVIVIVQKLIILISDVMMALGTTDRFVESFILGRFY